MVRSLLPWGRRTQGSLTPLPWCVCVLRTNTACVSEGKDGHGSFDVTALQSGESREAMDDPELTAVIPVLWPLLEGCSAAESGEISMVLKGKQT